MWRRAIEADIRIEHEPLTQPWTETPDIVAIIPIIKHLCLIVPRVVLDLYTDNSYSSSDGGHRSASLSAAVGLPPEACPRALSRCPLTRLMWSRRRHADVRSCKWLTSSLLVAPLRVSRSVWRPRPRPSSRPTSPCRLKSSRRPTTCASRRRHRPRHCHHRRRHPAHCRQGCTHRQAVHRRHLQQHRRPI